MSRSSSPVVVILIAPNTPQAEAFTGPLSGLANHHFMAPCAPKELQEADQALLHTAEILVGSPGDVASVLDCCPNLRWVQSLWAGVNTLLEHPRRDYQLTAMNGIFGQPMAEYVLGWLLSFERNILRRAQQRVWDAHECSREDGTVAGKRLGIMGTGTIARHVAQSARALGIKSIGLNTRGEPVDVFDQVYSVAQRLEFAAQSDYLLALLPATSQTEYLIDGALLGALPRGAIMINAGRGQCIDDDELVAAIDSGHLRAAVLDVFREEPLPEEHPFWRRPNIYITSHTAAPTSMGLSAQMYRENYVRYLQSPGDLEYVVDFERGY